MTETQLEDTDDPAEVREFVKRLRGAASVQEVLEELEGNNQQEDQNDNQDD